MGLETPATTHWAEVMGMGSMSDIAQVHPSFASVDPFLLLNDATSSLDAMSRSQRVQTSVGESVAEELLDTAALWRPPSDQDMLFGNFECSAFSLCSVGDLIF